MSNFNLVATLNTSKIDYVYFFIRFIGTIGSDKIKKIALKSRFEIDQIDSTILYQYDQYTYIVKDWLWYG